MNGISALMKGTQESSLVSCLPPSRGPSPDKEPARDLILDFQAPEL